jgi:hypothetical protein
MAREGHWFSLFCGVEIQEKMMYTLKLVFED